jgi:hypothetical protein
MAYRDHIATFSGAFTAVWILYLWNVAYNRHRRRCMRDNGLTSCLDWFCCEWCVSGGWLHAFYSSRNSIASTLGKFNRAGFWAGFQYLEGKQVKYPCSENIVNIQLMFQFSVRKWNFFGYISACMRDQIVNQLPTIIKSALHMLEQW